ncbi:retron Se72 family effector protein [Mixta calida]|nr:retron Se72 family effector protein [Mixta calida]
MNHEKNELGIVKIFNSFKGFGFITREKGKDAFFFYEDIVKDLTQVFPGDRVSFIVRQTSKGPRAYSIKKLS